MKPSDYWDVARLMEKLGELEKAAENVQLGNIDATIYGKYFGDHLDDDGFEALRAIALRYVAREAFTVIGKLGQYGIPVEDTLGKQLTLIDQIIGHYNILYPEPFRKGKK